MAKPETDGGFLWPPMLAFLLAACGTGEASSTQADSEQDGGQLRAVVALSDHKLRDCLFTDTLQLSVFDGSRRVLRHVYCSAYGGGSARIVTDTRGKHYILLKHSQDRGTHATSGYLTIYTLADGLDVRARLLISDPVGMDARSVYAYRVNTPQGGGMIVSGTWTLDRELRDGERAPERSRTVIALDTASEAR